MSNTLIAFYTHFSLGWTATHRMYAIIFVQLSTTNKMADTLQPFVYWGQKNASVSLKVDLRDATVSNNTTYS